MDYYFSFNIFLCRKKQKDPRPDQFGRSREHGHDHRHRGRSSDRRHSGHSARPQAEEQQQHHLQSGGAQELRQSSAQSQQFQRGAAQHDGGRSENGATDAGPGQPRKEITTVQEIGKRYQRMVRLVTDPPYQPQPIPYCFQK